MTDKAIVRLPRRPGEFGLDAAAGGFVRSPMWDGMLGVVDLSGKVCLTLPTSWPGKLVTDYRRRLMSLPTMRLVRRDVVPPDLREALAISQSLQKEGKVAIAHHTRCTSLKKPTPPAPPGGGEIRVTPPVGGGGTVVVPPRNDGSGAGPVVTVQGTTAAGVRFVRTTMRPVRIA